MSDGKFWSARITNGKIEFYRGDNVAGAAYYHDKPELFKYLILDENGVHEVSQEQKDIIDAAEAQAETDRINQENIIKQALEEEQAIQEAARAEALAIRNAKLNALRQAYRDTTNLFCAVAEIEVVNKIEDPTVIINAIQNSIGEKHQRLFEISMQIKFLIDELRRPCNDGDMAWDLI